MPLVVVLILLERYAVTRGRIGLPLFYNSLTRDTENTQQADDDRQGW